MSHNAGSMRNSIIVMARASHNSHFDIILHYYVYPTLLHVFTISWAQMIQALLEDAENSPSFGLRESKLSYSNDPTLVTLTSGVWLSGCACQLEA